MIRGVWLVTRSCWTFVDWAVYLMFVIRVGSEQEQMTEKEVGCWATFADLPFDVVQTRYQVTSVVSSRNQEIVPTHQDVGIMRRQSIRVLTPVGPLSGIPRSGRRWSRAHRLSFRKWYRGDITTGSNSHRVVPGDSSLHQSLHPFPDDLLFGRREEMGFITAHKSESIVSRIGIFVHNHSITLEVDVALDSILLPVS